MIEELIAFTPTRITIVIQQIGSSDKRNNAVLRLTHLVVGTESPNNQPIGRGSTHYYKPLSSWANLNREADAVGPDKSKNDCRVVISWPSRL